MVVIPILDDGLTEIIDRWGGSLPKVSISFLNTSISGHTSEESFRRYLCQNLDEEAREIIRRYVSAS